MLSVDKEDEVLGKEKISPVFIVIGQNAFKRDVPYLKLTGYLKSAVWKEL